MYKRAKKAGAALKQFLARHMKANIEDVKIGKYANQKIWERGIRFPPHHIKVVAKKDDAGIVMVELEGAPVEEKKEMPKKVEETPKEKPVEAKPMEEKKPVEAKKELPSAEKKPEAPKTPEKPKQEIKKPIKKTE